MQLREKPVEDAPVVHEVKAGDLLPLVVALTMSMPAGWTSIAMPRGGLGFTDQVGMNELTPPAVCLTRNAGRRMADCVHHPAWRVNVLYAS